MQEYKYPCSVVESYANWAIQNTSGKQKRHLIIVPPICGLAPPLDTNLRSLALDAARHHDQVEVVEFPGQNGQPGEFSMYKSCVQLAEHVARIDSAKDIRLVGLCSGAAASLYAASKLQTITHVLAWEVSPVYRYDRAHRRYIEKRFRLNFCDQTFFSPIQPLMLVPQVGRRLAFAWGGNSVYCDQRGQIQLAKAAPDGVAIRIPGLSHFLEGPEGRRSLVSWLASWSGDR